MKQVKGMIKTMVVLTWATLLSMSFFILVFGLFTFIVGCNGNLTKDVHDLQTSQYYQDQRLAALDDQLAVLNLTVYNVDLEEDGDYNLIQSHIDAILLQIATLQGYKNIVAIIDPCGDSAGIHDEVLLRLQDNSILASFSDSASGSNTRFSLIDAGSYVTTDGSNCHFTVSASGAVTY